MSGAARSGRFHKYLCALGHEVDVIAEAESPCEATNGVWRVTPYRQHTTVPLTYALARFVRRVFPYDDGLPIGANVLGKALEAIRDRHYDVILATAPAYSMHLAAIVLGQLRGIPVVCDFRDPILKNPFRPGGRQYVFDRLLDNAIHRLSDAIVYNTQPAADAHHRQYPKLASKFHVIWNGFDPAEAFTPRTGGRQLLKDIIHVGTLYGPRNPAPLLASFQRLRRGGKLKGDPRITLAGPIEQAPLDAAEQSGGEREGWLVVENRPLPRKEADAYNDRADAHLIVDTHGGKDAVQVPAKIFTSIRSGVPIIALTPPGSPTSGILERSGLDHCLLDPQMPPAEMDARLETFLNTPAGPRQPSQWFLDTFDGERQARYLGEILLQVMKARRR